MGDQLLISVLIGLHGKHAVGVEKFGKLGQVFYFVGRLNGSGLGRGPVKPYAVQVGVEGSPDVAGEGVPNDQHLAPLVPYAKGLQYLLKINLLRLAAAHFLGNKYPVPKELADRGKLQPPALDKGGAVGDQGQGILLGCPAAEGFCPGQKGGALGERLKIKVVPFLGIALNAQGLEKQLKPADGEPFPGKLPLLIALPEIVVDLVVELFDLLLRGQAKVKEGPGEGVLLCGVKVEGCCRRRTKATDRNS